MSRNHLSAVARAATLMATIISASFYLGTKMAALESTVRALDARIARLERMIEAR